VIDKGSLEITTPSRTTQTGIITQPFLIKRLPHAKKSSRKIRSKSKDSPESSVRQRLTPSELDIIKTDYKNGRPAKKTAADIGRSAQCIHQAHWKMFKTGELKKREK
jgi:hypothetical protein